MTFHSDRTRTLAARPPAVRASPIAAALDARALMWTGFALAASITALLLPMIPTAQAATALRRCIAADGTPIYTDRPCVMLNARRTPIPGELLGRIAREQRAHATANGDSNGAPRALHATARRSAASGCARTPTQLAMDLQGAWALADVNRVAESYHWVGLNHHQGQQIMQRLDRLTTQTLLRAEYFDARIGSGAIQFADAGGSSGGGAAGILQVTFADGGAHGVQDFDVERYRGCYFIRF